MRLYVTRTSADAGSAPSILTPVPLLSSVKVASSAAVTERTPGRPATVSVNRRASSAVRAAG